MSGMAFGISSDDVIAVALRRGKPLNDEQAEAWFDDLDHDEIEGAALEGVDLDEQTDLAFDEIERQLVAQGKLAPAA